MTTETHNKKDISHKYYIEQIKPGTEAYIIQFLFEIQDQTQKRYGNRSQHNSDFFRKAVLSGKRHKRTCRDASRS